LKTKSQIFGNVILVLFAVVVVTLGLAFKEHQAEYYAIPLTYNVESAGVSLDVKIPGDGSKFKFVRRSGSGDYGVITNNTQKEMIIVRVQQVSTLNYVGNQTTTGIAPLGSGKSMSISINRYTAFSIRTAEGREVGFIPPIPIPHSNYQ
jgi:hypothetical protein